MYVWFTSFYTFTSIAIDIAIALAIATAITIAILLLLLLPVLLILRKFYNMICPKGRSASKSRKINKMTDR